MALSHTHFSVGVTAFLDILGYSDRILNAKTDKDFESVIADIESIQAAFEFRARDKYARQRRSRAKKTVLGFSDCVVVNLSLQSRLSTSMGTFDLVMFELSEMALAQAQCVHSGLFLRGGVDLGWWYRKSSVLASESLVRAYRAENDAIMPVIRLSDTLYKWISGHPHRSHYSEESDPVRNLLREYTDVRDCKPVSFWYLDYLNVAIESLGWEVSAEYREEVMTAPPQERDRLRDIGYNANTRALLRHYARMIKKAHAKAANEKVKAKYEWLASYHNDIAAGYTTSSLRLASSAKAKRNLKRGRAVRV